MPGKAAAHSYRNPYNWLVIYEHGAEQQRSEYDEKALKKLTRYYIMA